MVNPANGHSKQRYGFSINYEQAIVLRDALEEELAYRTAISGFSNTQRLHVKICEQLLIRVEKIINGEGCEKNERKNRLSPNLFRRR